MTCEYQKENNNTTKMNFTVCAAQASVDVDILGTLAQYGLDT